MSVQGPKAENSTTFPAHPACSHSRVTPTSRGREDQEQATLSSFNAKEWTGPPRGVGTTAWQQGARPHTHKANSMSSSFSWVFPQGSAR